MKQVRHFLALWPPVCLLPSNLRQLNAACSSARLLLCLSGWLRLSRLHLLLLLRLLLLRHRLVLLSLLAETGLLGDWNLAMILLRLLRLAGAFGQDGGQNGLLEVRGAAQAAAAVHIIPPVAILGLLVELSLVVAPEHLVASWRALVISLVGVARLEEFS